jgi:hypothetical protein
MTFLKRCSAVCQLRHFCNTRLSSGRLREKIFFSRNATRRVNAHSRQRATRATQRSNYTNLRSGLQTTQGEGFVRGFCWRPVRQKLNGRVSYFLHETGRVSTTDLSLLRWFVFYLRTARHQVVSTRSQRGPCAGGTMTYPQDGRLRNHTDRVVVRDSWWLVVNSQPKPRARAVKRYGWAPPLLIT